MRELEALSRGDVDRLVEQLRALLTELTAALKRAEIEIAALRVAYQRTRAEINAQRAARERAEVKAAEWQVAHEQLQAQMRELQAKLEKLEKGGPRGMPGLKPSEPKPNQEPRSRKHRARGYGRARSEPTRMVIHAAERCPDCGTALSGGSVKRTREVIELVPSPAEVVEHVVLERRCSRCRRRVVPQVDLQGQVMGRQRLGIGLLALIATLREEGRVPVATIQRYLEMVHDLELSVGAIVAASRRVAERGGPAVEWIRARVRAGPLVHADETGWRESGRNGYVWTFSTPTARYFVHGGRGMGMIDTVLGDDFGGVLVSDFYRAYDHVRAPKQRCWAHLLRDAHELRTGHPDDPTVQAWADDLHRLYLDAVAFVETASSDRLVRAKAAGIFDARLLALATPWLDDRDAPQYTLSARIVRYLGELLTFVREAGVPPDNNAAERSLRHLVTSRKISGGTRSADGTATKMAVATLFGTWRAEGRDPLDACRSLLASPRL